MNRKEPHPRPATGHPAQGHSHPDANLVTGTGEGASAGGSKSSTGDGKVKSAVDIAMERAAVAGQSPQVMISPQELDGLRAEASKAKDHWDRFLRAQADLENYRKRVTRERQELAQFANENLLRDLLTPLDHFEIGLKITTQTPADDPLRVGMQMVYDQFQQFLKLHGVTEIEAEGHPFDPALHEAVAYQPKETPEGQVIQQIRKGYRLQSKVLRPSTVVVSNGKAHEISPVPKTSSLPADQSEVASDEMPS